MLTIPTNSYRYSYSGTDARAYCYFEGRGDAAAPLESLHTISWSVNEAKGAARALGYRGVKGFARGLRTIAGSLIMTVIEDNPLAPLMDMLTAVRTDPDLHWPGWSIDWEDIGVGSGLDNTDFTRRLATTIPPFNVIVQYVAEGSKWVSDLEHPSELNIPGAAVLIKGVEFVNEGMVTSISDAVSEITYTFVATDIKTLSNQQFQNIVRPVGVNIQVQSLDEQLKQSIISDQRIREQIYKAQSNELFNSDGISDPFSGVA